MTAGGEHGPAPVARWVAPVVLTLAVAAYVGLYLQTPGDFWFEDDANVAAAVAKAPGPWTFFLSREGLSLGVIGTQPVPFFNVTFWVDQYLAPGSPSFAYLHTACSLWLATLLLHRVACGWLPARWALGVTLLWLGLPGTICLTEYNSCRHFLEGFAWSLGAILCARAALARHGGRAAAFAFLAAALYLCASLSKQLYVATTFVFVGAMFVQAGRWPLALPLGAAGAAYVLFHYALLGLVDPYGQPVMAPGQYPLFLLRLPAVLTGSPLGWLAAAAWLGAVVAALLGRQLTWRHLAGPSVLMAVALATVFPASLPLLVSWEAPGPWSRVAFLPATLALFLGAWMITHVRQRLAVAVTAVATALAILAGAEASRHHWVALKAAYATEGRFYLEHPDRLVLSDVPAWWYLPGLHELYAVPEPHYVLAMRPDAVRDREVLARHDTLWWRSRTTPPRMVERRDLYEGMARQVGLLR